MKIAAAIHRVTGNTEENLNTITSMTTEAAANGADIILFSEAALTGLINNDDPNHDLALAETITGSVTRELSNICIAEKIWLATGLLEREEDILYDSAILIDPDGEIRLKYRRVSPGWHGMNADEKTYGHGEKITKIRTPLGSFAFLICGDLFDDTLLDQVHNLKPDWLLFPFARCFASDTAIQSRWDNEERNRYAERIKRAGITTIMTNYLSDDSLDPIGNAFGNAMIVATDGSIIDSLPPGTTGILYADL